MLTNALDGGAAAIGDEVLELLASEPELGPRRPAANAELSALVGRFVGKMPSFDEESYVSLFAESFRNAVPLAKMQEVGLAMTKAHGACTRGPTTEVRGAASATLVFQAGDVVPADCRILESVALEVDASSFTGESLPVPKGPAPSTSPVIASWARNW